MNGDMWYNGLAIACNVSYDGLDLEFLRGIWRIAQDRKESVKDQHDNVLVPCTGS